jgi:2,4-dienoyl-CoA reductase-like NADH-dependent reductase (Old Yellow Enzyme family)
MYAQGLLKPLNLDSLTIPTRIVMAPMTRSKSPNNVPGPDVAAYYRRRAENKVGLIITEGTIVEPTGHGYPDVPDFYGEDALRGWKRVVDNVHEAGGKIFPQLWHVGSIRQKGMPPDPSLPAYGPSAVIHPSYADDMKAPEEMTAEEIRQAVQAFADAATQAENLGFDGIELHGAHGYLIDQFLWDATNKRADHYGGATLQERMRFAIEVVEAVRKSVTKTFPLCIRFSQWKMGAYRHKLAKTPEVLEAFLTTLIDAGVDIFHCSTRRFHEPEFPGSNLNLAGWTKKLTGKPVITVGSVGLDMDFVRSLAGETDAKMSKDSIEELVVRLEREEFDLVAVGRALLADAEWVTKVSEGRIDDIKLFSRALLATLN